MGLDIFTKIKNCAFFSYFISGILKFSYMGFFRKSSMFHQSIPLSVHTYLQLHSLYSIQWFAVFASGQWFSVCAFFLYTFPCIVFVVIYHLHSLVLSVHTCISLCGISLGFVSLFNVFICKYLIIAIRIAICCLTLLLVTFWSAIVTIYCQTKSH